MLDVSFWGAANRADSWQVELLTNRDVYRRELAGVAGGSLNHNAFREVTGGGNLEIFVPNGKDYLEGVDWLLDRLAVYYLLRVNNLDVKVPWGVYLPSDEVETTSHPHGQTVSIPLLDKLTILKQDGIHDHYSVRAGTVVTSQVEWLIKQAGETRYAVTPSNETTRTALVWPAGTPRLQVINDLLDAIGYASLSVSDQGVFQAGPYVRPDDRTPLWDFSGGPHSIAAPEITESINASAIPNRFVVVSRETEDVTGIVGVAENRNPDSAYSYPRRGRWITEREEGVDATSQAVVDGLAVRRLTDSSRPVVRLPLRHLPVPLPLGTAVVAPTGHQMSVVERSVNLQPMSMMTSVLRRFEVV